MTKDDKIISTGVIFTVIVWLIFTVLYFVESIRISSTLYVVTSTMIVLGGAFLSAVLGVWYIYIYKGEPIDMDE